MAYAYAVVEVFAGVVEDVFVHRTLEEAQAEGRRLAKEWNLHAEDDDLNYWTDGENDVLVRAAEIREDPWVLLENFGAVTERVTIFPTYLDAEEAAETLAVLKAMRRDGESDYWTDDVDTDVFIKPADAFETASEFLTKKEASE